MPSKTPIGRAGRESRRDAAAMAPAQPAKPSSREQARLSLERLLQDAAAQGQPDRLRFWQSWRDKGGGAPIQSLAELDARCAPPAGALMPLMRLTAAVGGLAEKGLPAHALGDDARQLIRGLAVAWAQELVRERMATSLPGDDGCHRVRLQDRLSAHLTGAVQADAGVRLAPGRAGEHHVINALTETAAIELRQGPHHPVVDVVAHEVYALLDNLVQGRLPDRATRVDVSGAAPLYPASAIVQMIDGYRQIVQDSMHVRPFLAIDISAGGVLATDAAARRAVHDVLGLDLVLIEPPASSPGAGAAPLSPLEAQLKETLLKIIRALDAGPEVTATTAGAGAERPSVFISYAHVDGESWRDKLKLQLSAGVVDPWTDTAIQTGDDWFESIQGAMSRARCAVLLVTPGFLASRFITDQEVPKLLSRREAEGMKLLPVLASDCDWESKPYLKRFQMLGGSKPLDLLSKPKQNQQLADLARQIRKLIEGTS